MTSVLDEAMLEIQDDHRKNQIVVIKRFLGRIRIGTRDLAKDIADLNEVQGMTEEEFINSEYYNGI